MSLRTLLSSRPARAVARAGLGACLLAIAGCADQGQPPSDASAGGATALFARGLDDIRDLYIDPVSLRHVALSGAARLSQLDNRLGVSDSLGTSFADAVTLSYDGRDIAYFAVPSGNDGRRWGALLTRLIAAAKQASPRLAALPQERIEKAVFHGMTATLDRFSRYSGPEAARDLRAARDGFGGIGVTVDTSDNLLRVAAVSPHSPAEQAGIRPEDQIVAINGVATAGCSEEDAIHQLRGPIGTPIALRVLHPGTVQPRDLHLRRAFVTEPTVTMSLDGNIAVFRISSFNRTTTARVAEDLAAAQRQTRDALAGIVLDLRGNPGGLLDQAVSLSDLFIRAGTILSTVGRHPASHQYFAAKGDAAAPHIPIAVLINGGSASASEIVAAALQDAGRGVVIGSSSYGKGTVQTVMRLPNNGELIVTWARLVAPSGYLLQHHGVVPTLCTAALPDGDGPLAVRMQQAAAMSFAAARPRAALDDRGWAALRQSCPPRRTRPAIDLALAERLLSDPHLYSEALQALPATQVARTAAAAP